MRLFSESITDSDSNDHVLLGIGSKDLVVTPLMLILYFLVGLTAFTTVKSNDQAQVV